MPGLESAVEPALLCYTCLIACAVPTFEKTPKAMGQTKISVYGRQFARVIISDNGVKELLKM